LEAAHYAGLQSIKDHHTYTHIKPCKWVVLSF